MPNGDLFNELPTQKDARFSNGDAKVALFISIANFFSTFLQLFSRTDDYNHQQNSLQNLFTVTYRT